MNFVLRADPRKNPVDEADDGAVGGDERAHLRHEQDNRGLAQIGRFPGHVRAGYDVNLFRFFKADIVQNKAFPVFHRQLDDGMPAALDFDFV